MTYIVENGEVYTVEEVDTGFQNVQIKTFVGGTYDDETGVWTPPSYPEVPDEPPAKQRIASLEAENAMLGQQLVDLDLRLLQGGL